MFLRIKNCLQRYIAYPSDLLIMGVLDKKEGMGISNEAVVMLRISKHNQTEFFCKQNTVACRRLKNDGMLTAMDTQLFCNKDLFLVNTDAGRLENFLELA